MKFSTKQIILGASIFLTTGIAVEYVVYESSRKTMEAQIQARVEAQAFHTVDKIDRMLYERSKDIKLLATDPAIRSRTSTTRLITMRLKEYQDQYSMYASLSFFDMRRVRIADTMGAGIGKRHELGEYWTDIAAGKEFVVTVDESPTLDAPVIFFAQVVKDENDVPFGVVVSRMPVDSIYEITKQAAGTDREDKLKIDLVDRRGRLIYSNYNFEGILWDVPHDFDSIDRLFPANKASGSALLHHPGEEEEFHIFVREQGFLDFRGNGWILIAHIPSRVIFAPAMELRNRLLFVLLIFFGVTLILVFFFSRIFARPLVELSSVASAIGKGNLDIRAKISSRDEIGALASSINEMAKDLKDSHIALLAYNNELERRVEERSEKLMIERERRNRDERLLLEQKEESIATLAGGMAHDFNNILMSVMGNASLLQIKLPPHSREQVFAQNIVASTQRMADLTSQLLAYAKKGMYESVDVVLNATIQEALSLTRHGKASEVEMVLDLPDDLWSVLADPGQMKQVLINLFTNAFEAMEKDGGRLTVRTANTRRDSWECPLLRQTHPAGDYVEVSVSDTGHGIPDEIKQKIFEPFFSTKFLGRGLGLAAAMGIVQSHGGCISVESEVGRGTSVHINIPRATKQSREDAIGAAWKEASPGKILLVDDEPQILSVIGHMLTKMGHTVLSAETGSEALDIFEREKDAIQLAILDIQLGDRDGRTLFAELTARKPALKVLISSGYDEKTALEGIGARRPDGFIQKPYLGAALGQKIGEVLSR